MVQNIDPTGGDITPDRLEKIDPEENSGAQWFFSHVIDMFNSGHTEVVVTYQTKDTNETKAIKMTLTEAQPNDQTN